MAMALLDAGFPANRYRIDAVDISTQVLTHARRAVYGKNSFRGNELEFRGRYFEATEHGYRLGDAVRQQVRFQQGNLFAADFLPGAEVYDVIFCRNLLIYFDRATQDRAVLSLRRLLTVKGILFVGPSETGLLLNHDFVSVKIPLAFAFRKTGATTDPRVAAPASVHPIRAQAAPARTRIVPPPGPAQSPARRTAARRPGTPAKPAVKPDPTVDEASRLADQGRLVEAAKSCEEHLSMHGPSAQAFHLLGLIRAAAGNLKEADQYYRKALYLEPNHHDTLVHLAFLLEKQGNAAGAQVLRNRSSRLKVKSAN
jgi:chemotaxis protein methyltransferase WspC